MKQCFVISPIGAEGSEQRKHANDVFDYIIRPAMEECGVNPHRADHLEKPGRISEQMFQSIHDSDLCVAVLTDHNPNVFYELAIAQAAQRPVIILIRKGQILPFDVSDFRCVSYDLEIRSFNERTYIKAIVNYVKEIEQAGWKAPDLFARYRPPPADPEAVRFFSKSGNFGKEDDWLQLLTTTEHAFDLMGISLSAWRRTSGFRAVVTEKARTGCRFRVLMMDKDNPALRATITSARTELKLGGVANDIEQSLHYYHALAGECQNVEVRLLSRGLPYFSLTRSDSFVVLSLYLSSQPWGFGPLWFGSAASELYNIAKQEFDFLWEFNSPDRKAPGEGTHQSED